MTMGLFSWMKTKLDPAAPTLSGETTGKAIEILKTARIQWMRNKFPVDWVTPENRNKAFALYNIHHRERPQSPGCAPCHLKVFNWLMDEAFKDVTVTPL